MAHGAIGFTTTKTSDGFMFTVYAMNWSDEAGRALQTTLNTGKGKTRAIATRQAKAWTLYHRRANGKV